MPFETVNEQVYRQRQVKVCARCRRPIPESVQNRGGYNMAGSVAGSLGTSMVAGSMAGAVLGPVGALGGAIGGAIAGSRLGAAASDGVCDTIERNSDDICAECKNPASQPTGQTQWGGGRLGTGSEPSQPLPPQQQPLRGKQQQQQQQEESGVGAALGGAGAAIGGAASTAGEKIGEGWSWLRSSVTGGESESQQASSAAGGSTGKPGSFQPFQGGGRTLGASEPAAERPRNPSRLLGDAGQAQRPQESAGRCQAPGSSQGAQQRQQQDAVAPAATTQLEDDEALARRLQQQFEEEDQQR